jgi:ATP-dependent Lhr-like helicase
MPRFPPGSNVGTQLRARRARAARELAALEQPTPATLARTARAQRQLALPSAEAWFAAHGFTPFAFQREVWEHIAAGRSGLLHATTGAGKTYAVYFGLLNRALRGEITAGGLRLLWITPMRALAADCARALEAPLADLGLAWNVSARTGDTDQAERVRQSQRLPEVLVTTPESLSLMLTRPDCRELLAGVAQVVVDEWHELIGNKRGVQVQLALARLHRFARDGGRPPLATWGLSATLGNLAEAKRALLPRGDGELVRGRIDKQIVVDTLLPDTPGRFPWGGHLGIQMLAPVVREIASSESTLVFTNTRSQAEIWYQSILEARPAWAGAVALHHGSLDRGVREWVELALKDGRLRAVVATSSLDLGVDFLPVDRVLQIGSPKGVARLLQRAGRSGHAPGRVSRITLVPTHALELIEAAAAREAAVRGLLEGRVESRAPPDRPLDVLVQHLVTVAAGIGFVEEDLLAEVRTTASYAALTDAEWAWALDFAGRGGDSLRAYPEYHRITRAGDGRWVVADAAIARRHRMSVGTIVSDSSMIVSFANGGKLGTIEESFIARLRKGDRFTFGGKALELVRVQDMTAFVRLAKSRDGAVPRWAGARMAFSSEMADATLEQLEAAQQGRFESPELRSVRPLLELQARWSALPARARLVIESLAAKDGRHLFVYPFAGRLVHLGLASLIAYRVARIRPATVSLGFNDYGFELLTPEDIDWRTLWRDPAVLLGEDNLLEDVLAALNAGELKQRRFRAIARVAGLVFQGYPGQPKSTRQLQASSSLFYEVLRKYDAGNLLLGQAEREVLEQELELERMRAALARMRAQQVVYRHVMQPTPFGFALLIEVLRERISTERLGARIERMVAELERRAGAA